MVMPPSRISIRMAEGPGSMLSPLPFPPHLPQPLAWPQPVLRSLFATCLYISKDNAPAARHPGYKHRRLLE